MYGIWNSITKRFVFGISEPTKTLALKKFKQLNPGGWRCHRYDIRRVPTKWTNPPNPQYQKKKKTERVIL